MKAANYDYFSQPYVKRLTALIAEGKLQVPGGSAGTLLVKHDDWCSVFRNGGCNCEPELEIQWREVK